MTEEKKPNNDKIIVYSSYNTLSEAYEIKNMLERSGIPCFVSNENMATIYPMFDSEIGGIRLHLFEKDIQAANEILNTAASNGEHQRRITYAIKDCLILIPIFLSSFRIIKPLPSQHLPTTA